MEQLFAEFLLAALIMELTPGPNMTWLALLAAQQGRMAGFQAVAGITSGLTLLAIIAATGATTLIATWPWLYEAIRWGGILFLLYLAIEAWIGEKDAKRPVDRTRNFRRGFLINILNPKAAAVFLVMIPGFSGSSGVGAIALMTVIYLGIATSVHTLIVVFAGVLQRSLADPRREVIVRRAFAIALVGIAIWLGATTGRPSA